MHEATACASRERKEFHPLEMGCSSPLLRAPTTRLQWSDQRGNDIEELWKSKRKMRNAVKRDCFFHGRERK